MSHWPRALRFYVVYDKICREDILRHAYELACPRQRGRAGVDGMTVAAIEASGPGSVARGLAQGIDLEDVPAQSGAAGDDPGGSNRQKAGAGTNL